MRSPDVAAARGDERRIGDARSPTPAGPSGHRSTRWRRIRAFTRFTFREILKRRIFTEAGAVAFFLLLAIPPGMSGFASLYGLVADPATMRRHISLLLALIPETVVGVVEEQLDRFAFASPSELGWSFALGLGVSLLSASAAIRALIDALNAIFRTAETRGFLKIVGMTCVFTLATELFMLASIALVVALPLGARMLGLEAYTSTALDVARWPILFCISAIGMTMVLRFGPCRAAPRWRHAATAAAIAAALWIAMSIGFDAVFRSLTVTSPGHGSLGAIVAFMTWLWLSAAILLTCARFLPHARNVPTRLVR